MVSGRIDGKHGRNMCTLDGSNLKYNLLRKAIKPPIYHYVAASASLADWLLLRIGLWSARVTKIYIGVYLQDLQRAKK